MKSKSCHWPWHEALLVMWLTAISRGAVEFELLLKCVGVHLRNKTFNCHFWVPSLPSRQGSRFKLENKNPVRFGQCTARAKSSLWWASVVRHFLHFVNAVALDVWLGFKATAKFSYVYVLWLMAKSHLALTILNPYITFELNVGHCKWHVLMMYYFNY